MTAAGLFVTEDASALELHCDRVRALCVADPRRALECSAGYHRIKADLGAVFTSAPLEVNGGIIWYATPHPRFVALYESLLLRHRLDLPAGEVAA